MKNKTLAELNEQFKDCPTRTSEYEIKGQKYIVVSHFTGNKSLSDTMYAYALNRAMNEVLHRIPETG